ncbi:MAG TPA: hypothetical protein VLD86_07315 [Ilumatobacteraceae bacterium]|nr:hypothetical protein [Ilumatobacteraceae bacterium]
MSTSTIERPVAQHASQVRTTGPAPLVRSIGGVEAPAAGTWEIGAGQQVEVAGRRGLRINKVPGRVLGGTLTVADDLLGSRLDCTIRFEDTNHSVTLATRVSRLLSTDSWQADGTVTTNSGSRPVKLRLRYNGVFRTRGRPPVLWLTIEATAALGVLGDAGRRCGESRLKLTSELNLTPRLQHLA